jgi:hypothetical protein
LIETEVERPLQPREDIVDIGILVDDLEKYYRRWEVEAEDSYLSTCMDTKI